jgi:hypothetical protein
MPAKSKAQQKFMGMVHAAKSGDKPASKAVADTAKSITKKDAKDYASTKHKGLPKKVKEGSKPDYIDADNDGNEKETMKKAFADKKKAKIKESLEQINQLTMMISEAKKKYGKKMSETAINEDHFKVGDTVTCTASGMKGKVVKLDKPETGKYYHVKREDGKTVKYAPSDLKKSTKVKEEIYTAKMGQPPQDIDGGSAPAPKKPATASKTPVASKKPATASKTPATKVKEGADKKEDPPFDGPYKKAGDDKDQFGNKIKQKNVAKHLAKKGRAEVEKAADKKKEKVAEGWSRDNLAARLFENSEEHDHEASMAKSQLMRIAEQSIELFKMIQEGDNLEGWVASKITKANDYINAVHQNLSYEEPKEKTVDSTDDYISELRKNLERQISN